MFDNLIREIQRLERGQRLSIKLPTDKDGFFDRQCPSAPCKTNFKILAEDWKNKVRGEEAYCPLCRKEAPPDDWATKEQIEFAKAKALAYFKGQMHRALKTGVRSFNQRQRPGFISMSLSVMPDVSPVFLPRAIGELMEQRFRCEMCSCQYASIGAAFFCPACGHNSAITTFEITLETVRKTLSSLSRIREALEDKDAAENTVRLVIEQSLGKLVGAFERYTEALHSKTPSAQTGKTKRGSFQRLQDASDLWFDAVGKRYEDILNPAEMKSLVLLFQKRHILTHKDGIIDLDYLKKTGDTEYAIGQRVVVKERDVLRLGVLIEKIGLELKRLT